MGAWNYRVTRMTNRDIDQADRFGRVCAIGKCTAPATHWVSYDYVTGRAGRVSEQSRHACDRHAQQAATKHDVPVADPRPPRPNLFDELVSSLQRDPERVLIEPMRQPNGYGANWWARTAGGGWLTFPLTADTLDAAITACERRLAAERRLVPDTPWTRDGDRAGVTLTKAEDTAPWADRPWQVTVDVDSEGRWRLRAVLDNQFAPIEVPLGHVHMDLDRAVRTATEQVLPDRHMSLTHQAWCTHDNSRAHSWAVLERTPAP